MIDDAILTDLVRRVANLIRPGRVEAADYPAGKVRVRAGDMVTGWRPWLTFRAGGDTTWWAPEVGEQVLLLCPDGEPAQGWVLPAGYSTASQPPADRETVHVTRYRDGAVIAYDRQAHKLSATIPGEVELTASGTVTLTSADGITLSAPTITLTGDLTQTGDQQVTGSIHASGDIMADGASDNHHSHP